MERRRKNDAVIDRLEEKVDKVLEILNPHNNHLGVVAQVQVNKEAIEKLDKRPNSIRGWVVAAAVVVGNIVVSVFTRGK